MVGDEFARGCEGGERPGFGVGVVAGLVGDEPCATAFCGAGDGPGVVCLSHASVL